MRLFYLTLCVLFFLTSCSRLQWRDTDTEIYNAFAKADIPTTISHIEIDSLDLNVRIQSVEEGDARVNLLFIHGSPSSLSAWNKYLKDTTLIHKVGLHAIDRPGYGYSNFGKAMTSIDTQAKVISAVINEKNLENVITIGSSYGGPLAARLAVENERVAGIIMISPAIDPQNEQRIWQADFTQFWLTRWLVPTGYRVAGDEKTVHAQELALLENDWSKVKVPVMHIHGDKDDLVPLINIDYSRSVFSDVEVFIKPRTGHEIAWARPELVKPHIFKMIEKVRKEIN